MKKTPSSPAMLLALAVLLALPAHAGAWTWPWQSKPAPDPVPQPEKGAIMQTAALEPLASAKPAPRGFLYKSDAGRTYATEKTLAEMSKEVAGKIYYAMKDDDLQTFSSGVAVVCAVPLSDLKRESEFGRVVAEYYLTDLADRGIQVRELRLGKDINILPQTGEFILSQNIGELANDTPALDYVVVSTFSNTRKTLILQGRMVSLKTGMVKTSWRYTMPLNRELIALLESGQPPFTIAVKAVGNSR